MYQPDHLIEYDVVTRSTCEQNLDKLEAYINLWNKKFRQLGTTN